MSRTSLQPGTYTPRSSTGPGGIRDFLGYAVFWSWNTLFLAFVFCGLAPLILKDLYVDVVAGFVPWDFAVVATLIMIVPLFSVGLGFAVFRSHPRRLLALFYGLEAPLLILLSVRLFAVRQMTPGVAQLLIAFHVAAVFFLGQLVLDHRRDSSAPGVPSEDQSPGSLWLAGQSLALVAGAYAGAILIFYAVPLAVGFLRVLFGFEWLLSLAGFLAHPSGLFFVALLGGGLFVVSATLFIAAPIAMIALYARSWRHAARLHRSQYGTVRTVAVTTLVLLATISAFLVANRQPQRAVLALIAAPPKTDAERLARLDRAGEIRRGLLNAYAAPYRYFSGIEEDDHIEVLFHDVVKLSASGAKAVQAAYSLLARPLLYDGARVDSDQSAAATAYEQFFDQPLQRGEQAEVLSAVSSTWSRADRQAGLLDAGARKVRLAQQDITVDEHGPLADIEIHDRYENQTPEQQEIFYYFNLPESAVVTGLWLGDSDDRSHRFAFTVSPRGAAQEIYKREVERRRDPALLEQIGPRQYRLRVFPIPPKPSYGNDATPPMHVWLSYRAFVDGGRWPLPRLAERRNAYWDAQTRYAIHGRPRAAPGEEWVGDSVPVASAESKDAESAAGGEGNAMIAGMKVRRVRLSELPNEEPVGGHYAIVLDRSFSMRKLAPVVAEALRSTQAELEQRNPVDLYLTAAPSRGEEATRKTGLTDFHADSIIYYGGQSSASLLAQFAALRAGRKYDAVFVLTDDGSYDLAADKQAPIEIGAPLFFIHLGGKLPPGYDDGTLSAIQSSGGGVVTSLDEAIEMLRLRGGANVASIDGQYAWLVDAEPGASQATSTAASAAKDAVEETTAADSWAAPAARQWILSHSRAARAGQLDQLDKAHGIARRYGIVSPLSSMIVLVDDVQRAALRAAEARADRFDREVEDGKTQLLHASSPFNVHGTPEPEEWLLIALVAAGLIVLWRQRHGAPIARMA